MKEEIKAGDEVVITDSFGSFVSSGIVVRITESFVAVDTKGFFSKRVWYRKNRAEKVIGSCLVL